MVRRVCSAVCRVTLITFFLSTAIFVPQIASQQQQYDLHKYMDQHDLAYHFGVAQLEQVPPYDVTTPDFHLAYRDFPTYARDPNWIYPVSIEFNVNAFNNKYRVRAERNDGLTTAEDFSVTYYGKDSSSPVRTVFPLESELRRHYLATSTLFFDDDEDPDVRSDEAFTSNSALSLSESGVRGIIQGSNSLFRILPIKQRFKRNYAAAFDMREGDVDLATHIVFKVSTRPTVPGMDLSGTAQSEEQEFDSSPRKKKKKKKRKGVTASMKLGVIADFTVYDVMMRWGFRREQEQIFFLVSFYNEVQLMYREPKLMKKMKLTVALQSIGFFTQQQNDLGSVAYAEQYIENVCAGPYNNHDFDQMQVLTYLDIYDPNAKRLVAYAESEDKTGTETKVLDLPHPFRYGKMRNGQQYPNVQENRRSYDTIGLAWVGSVCDKRKHCSIVEMNSPIASFSAAHELGHSMGIEHEEDSKCPFNAKDPLNSSFMSAISWSANSWATLGKLPVVTLCTVDAFVAVMKADSKCLVKLSVDRINPAVDFKLALSEIKKTPIEPNALCRFLLGELWLNVKKWRREQIQRIYAPSTEVGDEMCHSLDCKVVPVDNPRQAFGFKFGPALPGTICSVDGKKVCYNFKCTDIHSIP